MSTKLKLIMNPIAGGGYALKILPEVLRILERNSYDVELFKTTMRGDAQKSAADPSDDCQVVVAMGGDGTVNEVVNGVLDSGRGVSVGIIPIGTANVLARELSVPIDYEKSCSIIINGNTKRIDVGRDEHRYFFLMSGVGFDAEVLKLLESSRTGGISMLTYTIPILKTFWNYDFPRFLVEVDGNPLCEGVGFMLVSNTRRYTGPLIITNQARIDDGELDIFIFRGEGKFTLLKYAFGALFRIAHRFDDVTYVRGKEVNVQSLHHKNVPYQMDGDSGGIRPQKFTVVPAALSILTLE